MRKILITAACTLALVGLLHGQAGDRYTLHRVSTDADVTACGAAKGKAAFVADIDEEGNLTSEWVAYCLVAEK